MASLYTPEARRTPPILFWAVFGAAMLAMQAYVYGSWIMSDDFRPVPMGSDPVPDYIKFWAVVMQSVVTALGVGCFVWVMRQSIRARRLTFDAMLWVGWVSCFWLDPVPNFYRPQVFFNSYYFNMGSWVEHIPGWISPTGALLPNSFLAEGMMFAGNILSSIIGSNVMGVAQRKWNLSNVQTYMVAVAWCMGFFIIMEELMIRGGWLAWPGAIRALSLHAGTVYQMPLTEVLLCGLFLGGPMSALRYFRDDRGLSLVERGVDRIGGGNFKKSALSLLAVVGVCNLAWLTYNVFSASLAPFNDDMPAGFPSYMTNNMCGSEKIDLCPSASAPIYKKTSPGVSELPGVRGNR